MFGSFKLLFFVGFVRNKETGIYSNILWERSFNSKSNSSYCNVNFIAVKFKFEWISFNSHYKNPYGAQSYLISRYPIF